MHASRSSAVAAKHKPATLPVGSIRNGSQHSMDAPLCNGTAELHASGSATKLEPVDRPDSSIKNMRQCMEGHQSETSPSQQQQPHMMQAHEKLPQKTNSSCGPAPRGRVQPHIQARLGQEAGIELAPLSRDHVDLSKVAGLMTHKKENAHNGSAFLDDVDCLGLGFRVIWTSSEHLKCLTDIKDIQDAVPEGRWRVSSHFESWVLNFLYAITACEPSTAWSLQQDRCWHAIAHGRRPYQMGKPAHAAAV